MRGQLREPPEASIIPRNGRTHRVLVPKAAAVRNRGRRFAKRALDVIVAGVGLVVLAPLLIAIATAVRVALGRPVFFQQERIGHLGGRFTVRKFRTMLDRRGPDGTLLPDEERLTRFGRFLRASSVDELPELVHVLTGRMSLVGPRPLLTEYQPLYTAEQRRRHDVRPGITGWAQINGRNASTWEDRFALDLWYVDNWSLRLDLVILARTIVAVFRRTGISNDAHATMPVYAGPAANSDGD
jgi:sugar transferase EpsL